MNLFAMLAEERIREAQDRGDFDNLPGQGRPLQLDDDSHVPEELRMAYKLLRNGGYLPPEIEERKEIDSLLDLLENCRDEQTRVRQMRRLEALVFHLGRQGRSLELEAHDEYYARVLARLGRLRERG
ncbi:MAG TPA: DUF1992 domain-containing protein [Candidatus Avidesulfovibrio excrementigallinarum]|nr:DUF1992 domain-containing protein [Candidatus Avidesulfovibrio excrementigallinarum]